MGGASRPSSQSSGSYLEQLVEQQHDEPRDHELHDDEEADAGADLGRVAVQAGHDVHERLAGSDDHAEDCNV